MQVELQPNLQAGRGGRFPVPTVLQMEATECAAACLGMILAFHRRWVPLEGLRIRCGVSRDGANAASILRTAREYGLLAKGFRCATDNLCEIPFPMILFWGYNHFVVLEGVRGKRFYLNDPHDGPARITREEFEAKYTGVCLGFERGPDFEEGGRKPGLIRGLQDRFAQSRRPFLFVSLATLALLGPGLAIPALLKVFVDDVLIGQNDRWTTELLMGLLLAAVVQGTLIWIQRTFLARMETRLSIVTTARFFWHVVTLPMVFFSQRYAGDLAQRVESNDTVARLLSGELAVNLINLVALAFYGAVMFAHDAPLTLVVLGIVAVNLVVLRLAARARENANRRLLKEHGRVAGASVSGVSMIETLKASGREGDFFARWSGIQTNALAAQQELGFVTALVNVAPPLLNALGLVAVLGVGGLRILDGALTIGGLVAFQALAQRFVGPVDGLVRFGANLQTVRGDIMRLDDVLRYEPDPRTARSMREAGSGQADPPARGAVELDGVTFGYKLKDAPLIRDFSLSIPPGRRVALVGGSGSGKSTVARLVCGLLTPWSGQVRIDGRPLSDTPPSRFAETVSHVDQEFVLFKGSVRENVALWDATIPERDIVEALRDAAIHDVIASRRGRYDAPVDEGGRNFSGGQRQRLEIARALARNPAILVLDEATAALGPITEIRIDDRLRRRGCTCLIVAHRLSTIRDADEIVVLERGEIVQRGRHDELIAVSGAYRNLVAAG